MIFKKNCLIIMKDTKGRFSVIGVYGDGANPRVSSIQSIFISCGCIRKLNVSFQMGRFDSSILINVVLIAPQIRAFTTKTNNMGRVPLSLRLYNISLDFRAQDMGQTMMLLGNILSAHWSPHCLSRINLITNLWKPLEIINYSYICEDG